MNIRKSELLTLLRLAAPIVAEELEVLEDCSFPRDDTKATADGCDRYALPDWRRLTKIHRELVRHGVLARGKFKKRPTKVLI